jgi:hypothetical protein
MLLTSWWGHLCQQNRERKATHQAASAARSTRGHVFECPSSRVRNADPADIDQPGTSIDDLMLYRYQPSLSQKEKHPICDTEVRTKVRFGAVLPIDEQL